MPHTPLSDLMPDKFKKIGEEEDAFDSYNEDTDTADTDNEPGQHETSDDTDAAQGSSFDGSEVEMPLLGTHQRSYNTADQ